jgi:hypothetical protein
MEKINVTFDGKKYVIIAESLHPLLLIEKKYGSINDLPVTLEGQLYYFYALLAGCNKDFDYTFERFVELLPYQENLQKVLSDFVNKKKVEQIQSLRRKRRAGCAFLMFIIASLVAVFLLIF